MLREARAGSCYGVPMSEPIVEAVLPPPVLAVAGDKLRVGDTLGQTWTAWTRNLAAFAGLGLVFHAPIYLFPEYQPVAQAGTAGLSWPAVFGLFALLFVQFAVMAGVVKGAVAALRGEPVKLPAMLRDSVRGITQALPVAISTGVRVMLWSCLLAVPGMIRMIRWYLVVPIALLEPGQDARPRSEALTDGHRWQVLGTILVLGLANMAVNLIVVAASRYLPEFLGHGVRSVLMPALLTSLMGVLLAVLYVRLRQLKDGGDTAQLAQVFA